MACCKRVTNIPEEQQRIIKVVNNNVSPSIVKSNRSPAGTVVKQCHNCGTKSIISICPVCSTVLK